MSFFEELKRRNVFRVGIAYLIVAWLVLQVIDIVVPILELPEVFSKGVLLLLAIGLPIAVILAWAYEMTPEGVKKERDVDRSESITPHTGRKLDFIIIGVLAVAVAIFALDKFIWSGGESSVVPAIAELDKSIAVLPFVNRSADASDAYFVDGIHDDILTQLHKLSGIDKVISRTSMERYRDTEMSIPEIAAELGVATILEGSVQRAGDRVRITVQLIDAANDEHMWAENFDRELTTANVFEIQSEISMAIAESLQAALTNDEANDLSAMPTENLAAYDAYLLGKHTMRDRAPQTLARAKAYFEEAIALDPEFALAYVGLSDAINLMSIYRMMTGNDSLTQEQGIQDLSKAQSAAMRALEINDRLGEAYASLGYSHWQLGAFFGSGVESLLLADTYYRRTLDLSPNYADLYRWYAQDLWLINRPKDALAMAKRAVALDPLFAVNHVILGMAYDVNGRFEEASGSRERSFEISPTFRVAINQTVIALRQSGQYANAIATAMVELERYPTNSVVMSEIAFSYLQLGEKEQFGYWSARALASGSNIFLRLLDAMVILDSGDTAAAAERLRVLRSTWTVCEICISVVAHIYAGDEQPEALLAFLEEYNSELLDREKPVVSPRTAMLVAPAVWALNETGELEQADRLAELGLSIVRKSARLGNFGYGVEIADVEIQAVLRNKQFALDALIEAVDAGYRNTFWLDDNHFLDPIRAEPEFIAAMDVIRTDLATQLEQLKEMERNGELPTLPR